MQICKILTKKQVYFDMKNVLIRKDVVEKLEKELGALVLENIPNNKRQNYMEYGAAFYNVCERMLKTIATIHGVEVEDVFQEIIKYKNRISK